MDVLCNDVNQLTMDILTKRDMNSHQCDILCRIDGGQSSLKVGITLMERTDHFEESVRSRYSDGVDAKGAKNSSVKKLILLAMVPDAVENFQNVKAIFDNFNETLRSPRPIFAYFRGIKC